MKEKGLGGGYPGLSGSTTKNTFFLPYTMGEVSKGVCYK